MASESKRAPIPVSVYYHNVDSNASHPQCPEVFPGMDCARRMATIVGRIERKRPDVVVLLEVRRAKNRFDELVDTQTPLEEGLGRAGYDLLIIPYHGDDERGLKYIIGVNRNTVDMIGDEAPPTRVYTNMSTVEPTPHDSDKHSDDPAVRARFWQRINMLNFGVSKERCIVHKRLLHRKSGRLFTVIAAHLQIPNRARERGTDQVVELMLKSKAEGIPCLAVGDFNTIRGSDRVSAEHQLQVLAAVDESREDIRWLTKTPPLNSATGAPVLRTFMSTPMGRGLEDVDYYRSPEFTMLMRPLREGLGPGDTKQMAILRVRNHIINNFVKLAPLTSLLDHALTWGLGDPAVTVDSINSTLSEDALRKRIFVAAHSGEVIEPSDHFALDITFTM